MKKRTGRYPLVLASGLLVIAAVLLWVPPIAQDPNYHLFADSAGFWGIPNILNVLSNLPFLLVGSYGLYLFVVNPADSSKPYRGMALLFFLGFILTGIGSGYYHLDPSNATLIWDRLPMSLSFMVFFCLVLALNLDSGIGHKLLLPLVVAGMATVFYWAYTEKLGAGDLRPYALVQFFPMLAIPLLLVLYPATHYRQGYIWMTVVFYLLAKVAEFYDAGIYVLTSVSGHSIKHLLAALAGIGVVLALRSVEQPRPAAGAEHKFVKV